MKNIASIALLFLILLVPVLGSHASTLPSETAIKPSVRLVKIYWSGLPIADFVTEIRPKSDGRYRIKAIIKSYGLAYTFTRYRSETTTNALYKNGVFHPLDYKTRFNFRKKERNIAILFDDKGAIKNYKNEPKENPGKRKPVPANVTTGAYDPLTAFLVARQKVIQSYKGGPTTFTLPVYDGRRRSDVLFNVLKEEEGLVHITLEEKPVSGYTNNEMQDRAQRDSVIHVLLSKEDFLPVKARGVSMIGTAHGVLTKECKTLEECLD